MTGRSKGSLIFSYLFGNKLLTRLIICLIFLLGSLRVVTPFPSDVMGRVWVLIVSIPDRALSYHRLW